MILYSYAKFWASSASVWFFLKGKKRPPFPLIFLLEACTCQLILMCSLLLKLFLFLYWISIILEMFRRWEPLYFCWSLSVFTSMRIVLSFRIHIIGKLMWYLLVFIIKVPMHAQCFGTVHLVFFTVRSLYLQQCFFFSLFIIIYFSFIQPFCLFNWYCGYST